MFTCTIEHAILLYQCEAQLSHRDHTKALQHTMKKVFQIKNELHQSQSEFIDMQQERNCFQSDLKLAHQQTKRKHQLKSTNSLVNRQLTALTNNTQAVYSI